MSDPLAALPNGQKPKKYFADGESVEVSGSSKSRSKYIIKRTSNHYYCSCPAWRNQSKVKVEVRTCKHLKELLGEAYETARTLVDTTASKPTNKAQRHTKVASTLSNKTSAPSKQSTRSNKRKACDDDEPTHGQEEHDKDQQSSEASAEDKDAIDVQPDAQPLDGDELAEIDGIKPKVYMCDGEEREAKSQTSSSIYKVKRTWDHYYCTCPAWRNQGGVPVNARSCKHIKSILGEEYEAARMKFKNPHGSTSSSTKDTRPAKRVKKDSGNPNGNGGTSTKVVPQLLLAVKWDLATGCDPTGWWMSEKLDGVRVYYDGKKMWSRLGNPFTPPQEFLDRLPKDVTLDGELFGGRGKFQDTVSVVKTVNSPHWENITFQIFDIPSRGSEPFEERVAYLKKSLRNIPQVCVVEQTMCKSRDHLLETLKDVEREGGEGVMLRQPGSEYEGKRSSSLLKVKTFYDGEAEVIGYEPGKGKHKGVTGALKCVMATGKKFSVGSGLTDKQRRGPPKVGTIVTYRFQELTRDGVPRFPTFVGIAIDKDKPSDPSISDNPPTADNED
ncbi:ATP-dependent DNA ligase domain protein [Rhizoctonia solani AG-3 Rhs1AP]|uniref:ATP-dependent DNA ligase domain protein n=2 Tax=Rhizoctonia solani AG-3 TaxID=1086053 RepID=A0A074S3P2_9AGAM|nr:ATP-dependent DNA ligase domain protein [Rhizoctonia solani AG-3 Rhs1AP]KEP51508.1 ATP-dependent DNA ligase domain protein [Rhizoctonia solani 123E]